MSVYRETVTIGEATTTVEAYRQRYSGGITWVSPKSEYLILAGEAYPSQERERVAIVRQSPMAVPEERWVIWSKDGKTRVNAVATLTEAMRTIGADYLKSQEA